MCIKCDEFEDEVEGFYNSPGEREAFHFWLEDNPSGNLSEFRDTDEWAQAFVES